MKKKKKILKVQEYSDEVAQEQPSEEKKEEDASLSDHQPDQDSLHESKTGEENEEGTSVSSPVKSSKREESSLGEEVVSEEVEEEKNDDASSSSGEPEVAEVDDEIEPRVHKKTEMINREYNHEIEKPKNILNESINEKNDSAKKTQQDKMYSALQTPGFKYTHLKQAARSNLAGGLSGKRDETLFQNMGQHYKDQSRFCQLQNSSSSSSEKDLAYNVKKYSKTVTQEVPEDDGENHDDITVSDSKKGNYAKQKKADDKESFSSSQTPKYPIFSFDYLDNAESNFSPDPKASYNLSDPVKGSTKPTPEPSNSSGLGSMGGSGMSRSAINQSEGQQPSYVKYYGTSDRSFRGEAEKDPSQIGIDRSQMGQVTIIENHYNNHTTINNYFPGPNKQPPTNLYGGMGMGQPSIQNVNNYYKNLNKTSTLVTIQIFNDGRGPHQGVNPAMFENLFKP